jgi:general secretion pathway protein K
MTRTLRSRQRGIALVLVIWIAVLLLVVASSFIVERRSELLVVRNSASMARAEAIADAGVNKAVFEMYRIGAPLDQWKRDGTAYDWTFDGAELAFGRGGQVAISKRASRFVFGVDGAGVLEQFVALDHRFAVPVLKLAAMLGKLVPFQ